VPEGGARWESVGAGDEKNQQASNFRLPSTTAEHKQEGCANLAASRHDLKTRARMRAHCALRLRARPDRRFPS
jgi:hypothetical protein